MFSLEDKIDNSKLYKTILSLAELILKNENEIKNLKPNEKSICDWISYVVDYMRYVLDNTDPALVTRQAMKEIEPEIINSYTHLKNFFSTMNSTHITASYTALENALNLFPKINHVYLASKKCMKWQLKMLLARCISPLFSVVHQ